MMDPESTKAKNEIMRRIKIYEVKDRNLPNFIRKKREEMLSRVFLKLYHPNREPNQMMC